MNEALKDFLSVCETYGLKPKHRTRFAWLPVRLHTIKDHFCVPLGLVWLCKVTEVSSAFDNWIAYDKFQEVKP